MKKQLPFLLGLLVCAHVQAAPSLQSLAQPDMIQAQVKYFESKAGPAKNIFGNTRVYQIGKCKVTAETTNKVITSLSFDIGPGCDFDTSAIGLEGKASAMTLRQFAQFGPANAEEPCIGSNCGNAADPEYTLTFNGSHAQGFLTFKATASYQNVEKNVQKFEAEILKTLKIKDSMDAYEFVGTKMSQETFTAIFMKHFGFAKVSNITFKAE